MFDIIKNEINFIKNVYFAQQFNLYKKQCLY